MAKKKRVNLYFDEDVYTLMQNLAKLQKTSVSQLITTEFWNDENKKFVADHFKELELSQLTIKDV